jgi:hypothetical protein
VDHGINVFVWQAVGPNVADEVEAAIRQVVSQRYQVVVDALVPCCAEIADDMGADGP